MGVAKTRLVRELTVKQLIQDLTSQWGDDEWDVLELVGGLLEDHETRNRDLCPRYRLEIENAGEEPRTTVKLQLAHPIGSCLRKLSRHAIDREDAEAEINWEDPKATVVVYAEHLLMSGEETPLLRQILKVLPKTCGHLNQFLAPLGEVFVRTESVIQALWNKHLPVPNAWIGTGLTKDAKRRGGERRKYDKGLQEAINWIREKIEVSGQNLTLSTLETWLEKNASEELDTGIPNCDWLHYADGTLSWTDDTGRPINRKLRSLQPYIDRAKNPD